MRSERQDEVFEEFLNCVVETAKKSFTSFAVSTADVHYTVIDMIGRETAYQLMLSMQHQDKLCAS